MAKVSSEAVITEVERVRKKMLSQLKKKQENEVSRPVRMQQPHEKHLRYENVKSATAEKGILRLLYYEPSLFSDTKELTSEDFSVPLFGNLFGEFKERTKDGLQPSIAFLAERFSNEEISILTEILNEPQELSQSEKALNDYINIIKTEKLTRQQVSGNDGTELMELAKKLRESRSYRG